MVYSMPLQHCPVLLFSFLHFIFAGNSKTLYMAKNSMFWGKASGKLGEAVLYRANGQERSRAYVASPKNPKTRRQARQRLGFASLTQVYNAAPSVMKFSFPLKKSNQTGFNAFISNNIPQTAGLITDSAAERKLCFPFGVTYSYGDLTTIQCVYNDEFKTVSDVDGGAADCMLFNGLQFKLLKPQTSFSEGEENTDPDKDWLPVIGNIEKGKSLYNLLVAGGNLMNLPAIVKATIITFVHDEENGGWKATTTSAEISADSEADISAAQLLYLASGKQGDNVVIDALGCGFGGKLRCDASVLILSYTDAATGKIKVTKSYIGIENETEIKNHLQGGDIYNALVDAYTIASNDTMATSPVF